LPAILLILRDMGWSWDLASHAADTTEPSFLCDLMLGSLCRWLRMMGYSCAYPETRDPRKALSDDELIKLAAKEHRVLLTRDEELATRAKSYCRVLLVPSMKLSQQLFIVRRAFCLRPKGSISKSRCPKCDGVLSRVAKKSVKGSVWPFVYSHHRAFWHCKGCGQTYWKGTHWDRISRRLCALSKK
jgi:uncharacterized protein with PIN domain